MRGGILADEMGMGKTLQTIALMIAHRSRERGAAATRDAGGRYHGGNLVIVPVIAMVQWRTELLRFTPPGYFSIYFYHGPKRESDPKVLAKYDIVLTTYSTLEYDYRIATQDQKVSCPLVITPLRVIASSSRQDQNVACPYYGKRTLTSALALAPALTLTRWRVRTAVRR